MANGDIERFLGGSPGRILVRLVFMSLLVGAGMAFLGLTPGRIFDAVLRLLRSITDLGFGALRDVGTWLVAGAVIVIPVWLLLRLTGSRK